MLQKTYQTEISIDRNMNETQPAVRDGLAGVRQLECQMKCQQQLFFLYFSLDNNRVEKNRDGSCWPRRRRLQEHSLLFVLNKSNSLNERERRERSLLWDANNLDTKAQESNWRAGLERKRRVHFFFLILFFPFFLDFHNVESPFFRRGLDRIGDKHATNHFFSSVVSLYTIHSAILCWGKFLFVEKF